MHARVYTCVYRHEKRVEEEEDDDEERGYINGRRSLARECIVKLSLRTAERGREKEKFQLIKLYEQIKYCARQCSGASTFLLFHSFSLSLSLSLSLLLIGHSTPRAQKLARAAEAFVNIVRDFMEVRAGFFWKKGLANNPGGAREKIRRTKVLA